MRKLPIVAAGLAAWLFSAAAPPVRAEPDVGSPPGDDELPLPKPPTGRLFGPDGPVTHGAPFLDRKSEAPPAAGEAAPVPPTRAETLDRLFARLAKTTDPDEASGIATVIEQMWMHSGSDTADLLMSRAMEAMGSARRDVALALLDKVVELDPDWAEAWNKRATLRFLDGDDAGAMVDIDQVLKLEPRHFGALSGMGFILRRNGMARQALTVFRKAQAIYPENPNLLKAIDALVPAVEGRDL